MNQGSLGQGSWVLGLDPSLTRSAAVLIPPLWRPGDWGAVLWTEVEVPPAVKTTSAMKYEWDRVDRIAQIVYRLLAFVRANVGEGALRAFVEMYAFGANSASVTKLAELGGVLRHQFQCEFQVPLEPVSPQSARKYLLGKLPRKDQKLAAHEAMLRHGVPWRTADTTDAMAIANYGLSELGLTGVCLG